MTDLIEQRRQGRVSDVDGYPRGYPEVEGNTMLGVFLTAGGGYMSLGGAGFLPLGSGWTVPFWVVSLIGGFVGVPGILILVGAFQSRLGMRRHPRPPASAPVWQRDHPWDQSGVSDVPMDRAVRSSAAAVLASAMFAPFVALLWADQMWVWLALVGGFIGLVLAVLITAAVRAAIRVRKFGVSRVRFLNFPFKPSEECRLAFSPVPQGTETVTFTLRFIRQRLVEVERSGPNGRVKSEEWQDFAIFSDH